MNKSRKILFRAGAIVVLLAIAALMFVIGRGHTIYFDNKTLEYNGAEYQAYYKANVVVKNDTVAKLEKRDRGMCSTMGQTFTVTFEITPNKGDTPVSATYTIKLPYNMDGIVLSIPGMMAGLPEEAYLTEFVSMAVEEAPADEEIVTDDFGFSEGGETPAQ